MAAPLAAPLPVQVPGVSPTYWTRAKRALVAKDPTMARIIAAHPRVKLQSRGDAFVTLARAIVGQTNDVAAVLRLKTDG